MFKRKGAIKHKASLLKFCSGITDLILKYHPRGDRLGSGVVYIKASLVKSKGGGTGLPAASCSHAEVPRAVGSRRDGRALKDTCPDPAKGLSDLCNYF